MLIMRISCGYMYMCICDVVVESQLTCTHTHDYGMNGGVWLCTIQTLSHTLHMTITMLQLTIAASFSFLQQLCLFLDVLDQVFTREGIQLKQQYMYSGNH